MTGLEFTRRNENIRLHMGVESARKPLSHYGMRRQSRGTILFAALKAIPIVTPIAALAWSLVRRIFPALDAVLSSGWAVGCIALFFCTCWGTAVWLSCKWQLENGRIVIHRGLFTRREITIDKNAVSSAVLSRPPLVALIGATQLRICTSNRRSDELLLSRSAAEMLASRLIVSQKGSGHSHRSPGIALWLAAFGGEGLAAFYSFAALTMSAAKDILGITLEHELTSLIQSRGLALASAALLMTVWLVKIIHTRLTYGRMSLTIQGGTVITRMGIVTRRIYRTAHSKICALDTRRSLPGRQSCTALLSGERAIPLLPPIDSRRHRITSAAISPHGRRICTVAPLSTGVSYAAGRWLCCLVLLPGMSVMRRLISSLSSTVHIIGIIAAALLIWRALMTTVSAQRAGLTVFSDCIELTGVRRLTIHTLRIFRPSFGVIRITQWPLSRMLGRCTLRITPRGNRSASLSCIKLPTERVMAVCERIM